MMTWLSNISMEQAMTIWLGSIAVLSLACVVGFVYLLVKAWRKR